jgi:hypothetical protein
MVITVENRHLASRMWIAGDQKIVDARTAMVRLAPKWEVLIAD